MNRRQLLKSLCASLASFCATIIAWPGARYILGTIRQQPSSGKMVKRVARLKELPVGRPVSVEIHGSRRDAWTTYPDGPLAQVWLVRRDGDAVSPSNCRVNAYSSVCPHLRCRVQLDAAKTSFVCPCHRGAFDLQGQPIRKERLGHANPAPGPLGTFAVRVVPDEHREWWVEVEYLG